MAEFKVDVRRVIPAARERVYRAFLEPEVLRRWMSPPGTDGTDAVVEERVDGRFWVEFTDDSGTRHGFDAVIRELVPRERIALNLTFVGPDPGMREATEVTITFADAPGGTEVRLVQERITLVGPFTPRSVDAGWNGTLEKLAAIAADL